MVFFHCLVGRNQGFFLDRNHQLVRACFGVIKLLDRSVPFDIYKFRHENFVLGSAGRREKREQKSLSNNLANGKRRTGPGRELKGESWKRTDEGELRERRESKK
jgi:hypothetical protein